jgi:hypothetical protein
MQNPTFFFPLPSCIFSRNPSSYSFSSTILSKPFIFVVKASSDVGSEASKVEREKG